MTGASAFRILNDPELTGAGRKVGQGERVRAEVVRRIGTNGYLLRLHGRLVNVRSEIALSIGSRPILRADWRGRTLTLIEADRPAAERAIGGMQTVRTEFERTAVDALVRSGMAVSPESLRLASRVLERNNRSDGTFARLVAMLLDRGLSPEEPLITELLDLFGSEGRPDAGTDPEGRHTPPEPEPDREPFGEPFGEPEDAFAESLRRQASPGDGGGALHLFNHLRSPHDPWQVVPFSIERGGWSATGALRLRRDTTDRIDRVVVEVCDAEGAKRYSIELTAEGGNACIPVEKRVDDADARGLLTEKLRNMGIEVDDTCRDDANDGFTSDFRDAGGIDALV